MIEAKLGSHLGFDFAYDKSEVSFRESLIPKNKILPSAKLFPNNQEDLI
jgi:hypothetical protein